MEEEKVYKLQNAFKKTFKAYKDRFNAITSAVGKIASPPAAADESESEASLRGGNKHTRKKKYRRKHTKKNTKY